MIHSISEGGSQTVGTIERILEPYIQGTNARLKELEETHNRTQTFVQSLNSFFLNKTVHFDLSSGITIRVPDGASLAARGKNLPQHVTWILAEASSLYGHGTQDGSGEAAGPLGGGE
jgi:hypothetical protein